MILRYADDCWTDSYISTLGTPFKMKTVDLDKYLVKNQIWDEASSEQIKFHTTKYNFHTYKAAHALILTVDLTDANALDKLKKDLQLIERYSCDTTIIAIAATKCDAKEDIKISSDNLISYHKEYIPDAFLHFVSSKTGEGIEELFEAVSSKYLSTVDHDFEYVKDDPSAPQASLLEMNELSTLIQSICSDFNYWKTQVRTNYGTPVGIGTKIPQDASQILVMTQNNPTDKKGDLLKGIGELSEYKHSSYFQWAHSLFRGRDDKTNNFYGILAQLHGADATKQSVVRKVIQDLKNRFPQPSNESTNLLSNK